MSDSVLGVAVVYQETEVTSPTTSYSSVNVRSAVSLIGIVCLSLTPMKLRRYAKVDFGPSGLLKKEINI